ncbi:hypothetical protein ACOSQ2_023821 [Xanthoceras sorbifolium]
MVTVDPSLVLENPDSPPDDSPTSRNLDADEDLSVFGKNIGRLCIIPAFLAPPHNTGQRRNRLRLHLQKSGDFWRWSPLDRSNRGFVNAPAIHFLKRQLRQKWRWYRSNGSDLIKNDEF